MSYSFTLFKREERIFLSFAVISVHLMNLTWVILVRVYCLPWFALVVLC